MSSDGLIWLDGSDVVYSNWLSEPRLETGCGHINTHSGFHWKISSNCSQEYYFICEFGEFYAFFLFYKIFIIICITILISFQCWGNTLQILHTLHELCNQITFSSNK